MGGALRLRLRGFQARAWREGGRRGHRGRCDLQMEVSSCVKEIRWKGMLYVI